MENQSFSNSHKICIAIRVTNCAGVTQGPLPAALGTLFCAARHWALQPEVTALRGQVWPLDEAPSLQASALPSGYQSSASQGPSKASPPVHRGSTGDSDRSLP